MDPSQQNLYSIVTPALIGLGFIIAGMLFVWQRFGPGSGRMLGNRIAEHLGIRRSLFYSILEHGVRGTSRELLAPLERSRLSVEAASIEIGPTLARGIERLEAHFGPQESVNQAKPIIDKLVVRSQAGS